MSPLSPLAESPRPTSEERQTQPPHTDNDLEMETPRDSIKFWIATIGTACPIEIGKPVAMADVAETRGPAGTGAGGPVVAGTRFTAVAERTGASGPRRSETGEPVVTGIRFQIGNDMTEASGPAVTGHRMGETNRLIPTARKTPRRETRLWLAWWGQQHPGSSRLMMLKWSS